MKIVEFVNDGKDWGFDPKEHGMYTKFTLPDMDFEYTKPVKIFFDVIRDDYNNGGPRYWRTVEFHGTTMINQAPMNSKEDAEALAYAMNDRVDVRRYNREIEKRTK